MVTARILPTGFVVGRLAMAGALLALCSAGCDRPQRNWTEDIDWSPDGHHAAVLLSVDVHALQVLRATGHHVDVVQTIAEDVRPIKTIRPSPDNRLVAVVTRREAPMSDDTVRTFIAQSTKRHAPRWWRNTRAISRT